MNKLKITLHCTTNTAQCKIKAKMQKFYTTSNVTQREAFTLPPRPKKSLHTQSKNNIN